MGQWHTKGQCDGAKGPTLCLNDKAFVYFWLMVQIPSNTPPHCKFTSLLLSCNYLRPNKLCSQEKHQCSIALVNISVRLSFVLMYLSVISPMLTCSLRKWYLILICLTC